MYRLFVSIVLIGFLCVCGEDIQSPCPEYFQYKNDATGVHGVINIQPFVIESSLFVQVNFAFATRLPPTYPGTITPIGSNPQLLQDVQSGAPIRYRVNLPVVTPLPKLITISVNNITLCYDSYDPPDVQYISIISHKFFVKSENSGLYDILNGSEAQNLPNERHLPLLTQNNRGTLYSLFKNNRRNLSQRGDDDFRQNDKKTTEEPRTVSTIEHPTTLRTTENPPSSTQTLAPIPESQLQQTSRASNSVECGIKELKKDVPHPYKYERGEWPWIVVIFARRLSKWRNICLGTLVSDRHVITAGHCTYGRRSITSTQDIIVRAGVYNLEDWKEDFTVTRGLAATSIHYGYNSTTLQNDILLLTLNESIPINEYIRPACLWSGDTDLGRVVGSVGVVAGWGGNEINRDGEIEPRMVRMPIVSTATCRASHLGFHKITSSTTLCAGDRSGSGPCLGDSGGGLYILHDGRWKLRGVISLSIGTEDQQIPCNLDEYIVFTDTAQYLPWIKQMISSSNQSL